MRHQMARSGQLIAPLLCGLAMVVAGCAQATATAVATVTPQSQRIGVVRATVPITKVNTPSGGLTPFYGMAASDSAVWVYEAPLGVALRIDPQTNTVVARVAVGKSDFGLIALGDNAVWVSGTSLGAASGGPQTAKVFHIDPQTNTVAGVIDFPNSRINGIAVAPGAVWVTNYDTNAISVIDPRTNRVVAKLPTYAGPFGASYGAGSVWVCNYQGGQYGLTRWDPRTRQPIAQIDVGDAEGLECGGVVALPNAVWVALDSAATGRSILERIDPATNKVVTLITAPASQTFDFAADAHSVWTWYPSVGLYRADPVTDQYVGAFPSPGVAGITLGAGSVWLANPQSGELLCITPTA